MIWHQSGVNAAGEPFVQLLLDKTILGQMSPEEARDHARAVTESAEASEQDAFLFHWAKTKLGADAHTAMMLIVELRRYRESRGKKGPPSDPNEFVKGGSK